MPKNINLLLRWGVHYSLLLRPQGLGIFQNLKGNQLNSANSEQKPIYVPLAAKVLKTKCYSHG